jgi:hypothetical protein
VRVCRLFQMNLYESVSVSLLQNRNCEPFQTKANASTLFTAHFRLPQLAGSG